MEEINKQIQAENTTGETEKINQIREILFGNNIAEFEKRFLDLEGTYKNNLMQLEENHSKRLKEVISRFESDIEAMKTELKNLSQELNKFRDSTDNNISTLAKEDEKLLGQITMLNKQTVTRENLAKLFQQLAIEIDPK